MLAPEMGGTRISRLPRMRFKAFARAYTLATAFACARVCVRARVRVKAGALTCVSQGWRPWKCGVDARKMARALPHVVAEVMRFGDVGGVMRLSGVALGVLLASRWRNASRRCARRLMRFKVNL